MAEATTSRYESNYIKIAMVVLRVSPRAVRVQFDKEFHPNCLQRTLKRNIGLLTDLKMEKHIRKPQWKLLFPRTGEPSSKDFDITLMICLLRNLIPIDIMDNNLPIATDTSLRADLSRIKFYRNIIVHECDDALVNDTDFESYWKDVTPAIVRLGGNSLKVECDDWYGRNLDAEQRDDGLKCIKDEKRLALVEEELAEQSKELAEQSKELAETKKKQIELEQEQRKELAETNKKLIELKHELEQEQSKSVPKNIRESFTEEIESWKKDTFFETSAVATILEEVGNKSFVVITGSSGMGKSTIVKLVALQLQKTNDYHILPIMCPKDIVKYFDPNIKQIYIIDDICGKFSVDQSMINSWERVNRQILKYRKDNKEFRVLGTCRLEISISSPFRKLQEKYEITECNLLQKKFLYNKEEKLKIAACHIDEETIKQLDDKILNAYNMFPLLCMMYAASKSNPGVRFFEYPLQAIEEQLDKMQEQNECCFIGLALIVIYNNKLYKQLLQNRHDKKFEDVFNDVFEDLGLVNRPSKRSVLSGLQAQEGIYTKELESTITVIHDKIFDIFALYFGKRIPKTILTRGSGTFIAERFSFEFLEEDCDDLKIVLPSELEHSYFNRMMEEIKNNRFYNVFENVQVRNELYQGKFISFLSKHQSIIQKLLYNKWPLYLSAVNGGKLLVQFILNEKRTNGMCNKLDKDGNHQDMLKDKPESDMYACSSDSDTNSESKNEWDFYDNKDDKRTTEEDACRIQFENSPMVAACEGGYIDIVEFLVKYGYNIDHSDTNLPKPLFSACNYNNKDVVDFLLKRNCKVNAINGIGQTALHAACKNGNIDIVNSLLKCNSSMNLCDITGFTPLYIACRNGHTDVVQILLDNNCDIPDNAIHGACEGGYKDIVKILIKHNVDINQHDSFLTKSSKTPIEYACLYGHTDVVKLLIDNNCDVLNNDGFSGAFHFACLGGFVDIVDLLLRNNCNINQCDNSHVTPIVYACFNGRTDVVKLLLDNNCDVLDNDGFSGTLNSACLGGFVDIVDLLLRNNCNINQCDTSHVTPIEYACRNGRTDVVKLLLDNNCDVLDNNGFSGALNFACLGGFVDIVDLLLRNNCNINQCDTSHVTPIEYACLNGRTDVVKLLLDNNCDVLDNNGFSGALNSACLGGFVDIVDLLLRNNCNINQCCPRTNQSPLIVACHRKREAVLKLLLSYETCDVNIIDNNNRNALHYVCRKGQSDVVELLLKEHCNVNLKDKWMKTPLFIACQEGHVNIVKMLINKDNCMIDVLDVEGNGLLHATCGKSCLGEDDIRHITANMLYSTNITANMFYSTKICRIEIIGILMGKSCDVNVLNNEGQSVLHAACNYGDTEIVDILLRNNSNVNQCDKAKKTPLFIACEEGYIDIVRLLIESKCEIFNHSRNGQTVLHVFCRGFNVDYLGFQKVTEGLHVDHKDILTLLIDKKCDVNISDDNSQTPLHIACYKGNVAFVEILLRNKCVVDQCDNLNKTPFFLACEEGHKDVVKSLMNNNCNMDIRDKVGRSALHAVCATHSRDGYECRRVDIVELLINEECCVYFPDEWFAYKCHRVYIAELLINNKCGVYDLDDAGQSALHAACKLCDPGIVKLLLKNKLDVDQRDKMGETPIFNACRVCRSDTLKLLIEWNCDVSVLNINGLNALNIAFNSEVLELVLCTPRLKTQFKEIVKLLVDSDCSVNICDADGQIPLHRACSKGYVDEAELFLKRNSNINQCDKMGETPLILAVKGMQPNVVAMLVENKCAIDICDIYGFSALDSAVENQFVDIKNILLNAMKKNTNAHDACTE